MTVRELREGGEHVPADCDDLPLLWILNGEERPLRMVWIDPPKNWGGYTPAVRLVPATEGNEASAGLILVSPRS